MTPILVIPCHLGDAALADRLITEIFHLNDKRPQGHALIGFAPDVHAELRETIKIFAGLAFESFEEIELRAMAEPPAQRYVSINNVFRQLSLHVYKTCRLPWLWLEPDCIPTKKGWLTTLAAAYEAQPKLNMANHMVAKNGEMEHRFTSRVGIYAPNAFVDLQPFFDGGPIERRAGPVMMPATTKTRLMQQMPINTVEDIAKVWPEAVLVHGDKKGILRDHLADKAESVPETNGHGLIAVPPLTVQARSPAEMPIIKRRPGRPPKIKSLTYE